MSALIQPIIVKIFLYSNTYVDRKLIAALRRSGQAYAIAGALDSKKHFYVMVDAMNNIIRNRFGKELDQERNYPSEKLFLKATSLYYIDNIIRSYSKLRFFEVNVIDDEVFTRQNKDTIDFDFRIVYSKVDLPVVIRESDLMHFERAFEAIGLWNTNDNYDNEPYFIVESMLLVQKLETYIMALPENSPDFVNAREVKSFFDAKLYEDNSKLLIIMRR